MRELDRSRRDVHVARSFDEFPQHAKGFLHVFKAMLLQNSFPFRFGALELPRKRGWRLAFDSFLLEDFLENLPHSGPMAAMRPLKLLQGFEAHQTRQALLGMTLFRNAVRLQVALHLETV